VVLVTQVRSLEDLAPVVGVVVSGQPRVPGPEVPSLDEREVVIRDLEARLFAEVK
jgi:hypothetical protein